MSDSVNEPLLLPPQCHTCMQPIKEMAPNASSSSRALLIRETRKILPYVTHMYPVQYVINRMYRSSIKKMQESAVFQSPLSVRHIYILFPFIRMTKYIEEMKANRIHLAEKEITHEGIYYILLVEYCTYTHCRVLTQLPVLVLLDTAVNRDSTTVIEGRRCYLSIIGGAVFAPRYNLVQTQWTPVNIYPNNNVLNGKLYTHYCSKGFFYQL